MSLRRQSRELALQVLFQREFSDQFDLATSLQVFRQSFSAPEEVWDYAKTILTGIEQNRIEIDRRLSSISSHWKIDRMSLVDANIMRVAVYELEFSKGDVPAKVAINEALEICKKYSGRESASFVNGILDQIAKGLAN